MWNSFGSSQSFRAAATEVGLLALPVKIKCLHVQVHNFPRVCPGLIYFLKSCSGIETLVFNLDMCLEKVYLAKHLMYLNMAVLKDAEFEIKDKEVLCL